MTGVRIIRTCLPQKFLGSWPSSANRKFLIKFGANGQTGSLLFAIVTSHSTSPSGPDIIKPSKAAVFLSQGGVLKRLVAGPRWSFSMIRFDQPREWSSLWNYQGESSCQRWFGCFKEFLRRTRLCLWNIQAGVSSHFVECTGRVQAFQEEQKGSCSAKSHQFFRSLKQDISNFGWFPPASYFFQACFAASW